MSVAFATEPVPDSEDGDRRGDDRRPSQSATDDGVPRVSLAVARDRANLLHEVYASTLDVMHHRYFHRERAVIPARAMEDVFSTIKRQSHIEARWIAVNLKAMNIDHEPATPFEKQAAHNIAAGQREVEIVEDGYYRRAAAIPLQGGCVNCHGGFATVQSSSAKFAGLIISVPVQSGADLAPASAPKPQ
jgi:hypothetical protein